MQFSAQYVQMQGGGGGWFRMEGPQLETQVVPCVLIFCSRPGVWGLGEMRETRAPDQAWSLAGGEHPHPVKRKQAAAEPGLGAHRRETGHTGLAGEDRLPQG